MSDTCTEVRRGCHGVTWNYTELRMVVNHQVGNETEPLQETAEAGAANHCAISPAREHAFRKYSWGLLALIEWSPDQTE